MKELLEIDSPDKPEIPKSWEYDKSVKVVQQAVYSWKNITTSVLIELYVAREKLSEVGNPNWNKSSNSKTWSKYCEDIGASRQVVNRWLAWHFGASDKITPSPDSPKPENKELVKLGEIYKNIDDKTFDKEMHKEMSLGTTILKTGHKLISGLNSYKISRFYDQNGATMVRASLFELRQSIDEFLEVIEPRQV